VAQQGSPPRRPWHQPDPEHRGPEDRPARPRRPERTDRGSWQASDAFGPDADADLPQWATPSSFQERPGGSRPHLPRARGGRGRERYADPYADQYDDPYAAGANRGDRRGSANQNGGHEDSGYQDRGHDSGHQDRSYQDRGYQDAAYQDAAYQEGVYQDRIHPDGLREDRVYQDGGYQDRAYSERAYLDGGRDTALRNGGHRDGGYREGGGPGDAVGGSERYQGRRRAPDPVAAGRDSARVGSYQTADTDAEPDAPGPGRGLARRTGRAAATRLRKSRRRVYYWAGIAIVIVALAGGGIWIFGRSTAARAPWVTSLQAGEYKSVPSSCSAVNTSVLNSYLPKSGRTQRVSVGSGTDSQCSYSFDKRPTFLVLQVAMEALQPFAAAGNNGSATANAQVNYAAARQALARPPRKSPLPPATITRLAGLGQQALVAIQHEHVSGIGTDVVTIVIRQRNDLITVSVSGEESGHGFGPVPDATLAAAAKAAAASAVAKAESEPTA
jgi:hypothetical protein